MGSDQMQSVHARVGSPGSRQLAKLSGQVRLLRCVALTLAFAVLIMGSLLLQGSTAGLPQHTVHRRRAASMPTGAEGGEPAWPGNDFGGFRCGPGAYAAYQRDRSVVPLEQQCEPHPWLLPPRAKGLSYSGVTNEEELLALRVAPFKQHKKTLSLFVFTRSMAILAQNYVYTLVRFAGVTNYVAATGSPEDFQACLDLNLPCWDAARFIPNLRLNASDKDSLHGTKQYNAITWWKPRLVAYLVERGFVIHMSDVDIAYSTKPLWASYLRYIDDARADSAMAHELGRVKDYGAIQFGLDVQANTGNYVVLPTLGGRALMRRWADAALLYPSLNDQQGFFKLRNITLGTSHDFCWMPQQCERARAWADAGGNNTGVVRLYALSSMTHFPSGCLYSNTAREQGMIVDPCHWTMMYVHVICRAGAGRKTNNLKGAGFWFIDDSEIVPAGQIPRCKPLRWSYPHIEDEFLRCREYPLALTYVPFRERTADMVQHARTEPRRPLDLGVIMKT